MKDLVRISKRMSYVLRHAPQTVGLELDERGWVEVTRLTTALHLDRTTLDAVVADNDKHRFAIEVGPDDVERIRASQGHTVDVDLGLEPTTPPDVLFHGTDVAHRESIRAHGLVKRQRHHVHLSKDEQTAYAVGRRRGPKRVLILRIDAGRMARAGFAFYRSANGVWLTDSVPSEYIDHGVADAGGAFT